MDGIHFIPNGSAGDDTGGSKLLAIYMGATRKKQKMMLEVCQSILVMCPAAFVAPTVEMVEQRAEARERERLAARGKLRLVSSRNVTAEERGN